MSNNDVATIKDEAEKLASLLYDLYMDAIDDGIIDSGQNNATQNNIN